MTYDEVIRLAEEVFDEEYSGLDKDSFLIGFQESYNALTALYKDKFELVKRMREAQKELDTCSIGDYGFMQHCAAQLESEVDELIKEMEGNNRRKSLEAENTEFDYGHNVKHYSED